MTRGDRVIYRCLAGHIYDAEVVSVQLDGRLDLAVQNGSSEPTQLTRIKFVESDELVPGTCAADFGSAFSAPMRGPGIRR